VVLWTETQVLGVCVDDKSGLAVRSNHLVQKAQVLEDLSAIR